MHFWPGKIQNKIIHNIVSFSNIIIHFYCDSHFSCSVVQLQSGPSLPLSRSVFCPRLFIYLYYISVPVSQQPARKLIVASSVYSTACSLYLFIRIEIIPFFSRNLSNIQRFDAVRVVCEKREQSTHCSLALLRSCGGVRMLISTFYCLLFYYLPCFETQIHFLHRIFCSHSSRPNSYSCPKYRFHWLCLPFHIWVYLALLDE